jgi:hypothetical protein
MRDQARRFSRFAVTAVVLLVVPKQPVHAQTTVGGHLGFLVPWVTHEGGQTTSVFDSYSFGMPFGISVQGQGRMFVDFEFIPTINQSPRGTTLTVDPGVLYKLDHGFTVGLRAVFDIDSSRAGFIPLVNKGWKLQHPIGIFKTVYAEVDVPVKFSRPPGGPATNPVTFATQFGFSF